MGNYILIGSIILIVLWIVSIYNRLVALRNNREQAFADIDVQLQQRHDLIPQLVASVKGYMQHEEGVLTKVTQTRQNAINANGINEKITAENELSGALNGLKIQVEAYPELKANQNFIQLQNEISDVENKLAASRRFFNSSTKELNTSVQKFPNNLLSGMFGFSMQPLFEISSTERATVSKAPKIEF